MDKENAIKNFLKNETAERFHTGSPPKFINIYVNGRAVRFNYVYRLSGRKTEFIGKTYHTAYQTAEGENPIIEIVTMTDKRNKPFFVGAIYREVCEIGNSYIIQ